MSGRARYQRALQRGDLSQVVVHLSCGGVTASDGSRLTAHQVLYSILSEFRIRASARECVTKFEPAGATCFYDIPPALLTQLIETNPNGRRGYGVMVAKTALWRAGGRPAIYDGHPDSGAWPVGERYRLIWTDLNRHPDPVDWTHEREWRFRGDLDLASLQGWWWPCVEADADCEHLFRTFPHVRSAYSLQTNRAIPCAT